jgi:excisionase family DNA binding protein
MPARAVYTLEEAAQVLGYGRTLIRRLAREGSLPGLIKLGAGYRVSKAVIDELLARGNVSAAMCERAEKGATT